MQIDPTSSSGFPPVAGENARVLILGSLPGVRSIQDVEYYAHPQNSFWRIMQALTGANGDYAQRCQTLLDCRIALWDVLANSVRPGSLDANIDMATATTNDFSEFFSKHTAIDRICFNGQTAAKIFANRVVLDASNTGLQLHTLPSTSPAFAAMSYADKLDRWRSAISIWT